MTLRRFEDKVVVVTGGSRGIGLAIGERFAAEGARVALVANEAQVHAAAAALAATGATAIGIEASVTDRAEVRPPPSPASSAISLG